MSFWIVRLDSKPWRKEVLVFLCLCCVANKLLYYPWMMFQDVSLVLFDLIWLFVSLIVSPIWCSLFSATSRRSRLKSHCSRLCSPRDSHDEAPRSLAVWSHRSSTRLVSLGALGFSAICPIVLWLCLSRWLWLSLLCQLVSVGPRSILGLHTGMSWLLWLLH